LLDLAYKFNHYITNIVCQTRLNIYTHLVHGKITQVSESVTFASKESSWSFYGTFQKLTIQ